MLVHWIWFAGRSGINDRERLALLEHFHGPEDIYLADEAALAKSGVPENMLQVLLDKDLTEADRILTCCAERRIHLLTLRDAAYPNRLRNIPDPPAVLYYKGQLPDLDGRPVIGIVGTRKASIYGLSVAKRMGSQICKYGGIVVSGMAFGIDGVAMRGALSCSGSVVGVLGCGVDVVYPAANRALYDDMERYGCLISEFPPGTQPNRWNFPKRNRIISGMSCGVLVVEAPERSGALITAGYAGEQGRDVFVVPGNIDVPSCAGSNALLREGAIAVTSGWEVLCEYEALYPDKLCRDTKDRNLNADADRSEAPERKAKVAQPKIAPARRDKKDIDKVEALPYSGGNTTGLSLPEAEQTIVNILKAGEHLVDDVIAAADMDAAGVLAALTVLRIKGIVVMRPGGYVALK